MELAKPAAYELSRFRLWSGTDPGWLGEAARDVWDRLDLLTMGRAAGMGAERSDELDMDRRVGWCSTNETLRGLGPFEMDRASASCSLVLYQSDERLSELASAQPWFDTDTLDCWRARETGRPAAGFIELRRWRWTSCHASSGPSLDMRKKPRFFGAEQDGPDSGPPALDDSVSEPEMNSGLGGAYGLA